MWGEVVRLLLVLLIALSFQTVAAAREWTDISGKFTIQAEFVEITADKTVRLKRPDGRIVAIPLSQLGPADAAYVAQKTTAPKITSPFKPVGSQTIADPADTGGSDSVIATGVGITTDAALKNAFHQAVRQVVGTLVDAKVQVKNDKLIEDKVITLSGGFVTSYDSLSENKHADGLIHIRIAARVERRKLLSALRGANVSVKPIAGDNMFAELATKLENKTNATQLTSKLLAGYPASVIHAEVTGRPRIRAGENQEAVVEYDLKISVDEAKYDAVTSRLIEVLDKSVDAKGQFTWTSQTPETKERYLRNEMIDDMRAFTTWFDEATQKQIGGRNAKEGPDGTIQLGKLFALSTISSEQKFGRIWWKDWNRRSKTIPLVINSARNGLQDRTTWKWFHVPATFPLKRGATVTAAFVDGEGKTIISDQVIFERNSPAAMTPYHNNGTSIVLSPFWVYEDDGYTSNVTIKRTVRLTSDEVKTLKSVRCSVTPR